MCARFLPSAGGGGFEGLDQLTQVVSRHDQGHDQSLHKTHAHQARTRCFSSGAVRMKYCSRRSRASIFVSQAPATGTCTGTHRRPASVPFDLPPDLQMLQALQPGGFGKLNAPAFRRVVSATGSAAQEKRRIKEAGELEQSRISYFTLPSTAHLHTQC